MPVSLFKLVITAETTTTVSTKPDVKRYFYTFDPQHLVGGTLTIPATAFVDDQGDPVTELTLVTPDNGYYLLFANGVLQQSGLYTVTETNVVMTNISSMQPGEPITLIVTNFAPEADSNTTITT